MYGAILGDISGSKYEHNPVQEKDYSLLDRNSRFTGDTIQIIALADSFLNNKDYSAYLRKWILRYPLAGYSRNMLLWARDPNAKAYPSLGNLPAARVIPVAYASPHIIDVMDDSEQTSSATHSSRECIPLVLSVAATAYLALHDHSKPEIKEYLATCLKIHLNKSLTEIKKNYSFDMSCSGSVPEALTSFFETGSTIEAIRQAVLLGGDANTMACIAGGLGEAMYHDLPEGLIYRIRSYLTPDILNVLDLFYARFPRPVSPET